MSCKVEFYVSVAAVVTSLLFSPSVSTKVEVRLQKDASDKIHSIIKNSTVTRYFECRISGLSEDELTAILSGNNHAIRVTVDGDESTEFTPNDQDEQSGKVFNVRFHVVNKTLVVNGEIVLPNLKKSDTETEDTLPSICEVIFQESTQGSTSNDNEDTNRNGRPPQILSNYDHVILMNGAPEQIVSCIAEGDPTPEVKWIKQGDRFNNQTTDVDTLIPNTNVKNQEISYLLFSQVSKESEGNYTCTAENQFGNTSKSFEIQVISVEAINLNCTAEDEDSIPSHSIADGENILNRPDATLKRSKRHLWYQWRGKKVVITYPIRPGLPASSSGNNAVHTDLQKMVNVIAERLNLADLVAVNKWDNNKPVEDTPRERVILENMVRQAENRGLDSRWAERFFREQIEANKDIQFDLIRTWQYWGRRPPGPPVDLNDIRVRIDAINNRLMDLAKSTESERREWNCRAEVEKNARYATFLYNLDSLHQRALQRATEVLCIGSTPQFPYHDHDPPLPN